MINASLNWASISGLFLILIWIPAIASGVFRIWFTLSRRADTSPRVILKTLLIILLTIGRAFCIPLAGGILFFQGWRLDPILQFGQFLLVGHIINLQIALILSEQRKSRKELSLVKELKTREPVNGETSRKDAFGNIETYLENLQKWKSKKLISEEDFQAKKKKLLDL